MNTAQEREASDPALAEASQAAVGYRPTLFYVGLLLILAGIPLFLLSIAVLIGAFVMRESVSLTHWSNMLVRGAQLLASAGLALTVYGARGLLDSSAAFADGIAAAASVTNQPVLVSVYLQGGIDSMSVLYPAGDPLYSQFRTDLALPLGAGPAFTEDTSLSWNPLAAPLEPPLLGGRRHGGRSEHRLDGPLPRHHRQRR